MFMTSTISRILCHEELITEDKKREVMEEFISFYGEERRKDIESKFSKVKIITYLPKRSIEKIIKIGLKSDSLDLRELMSRLSKNSISNKYFYSKVRKIVNRKLETKNSIKLDSILIKLIARDLYNKNTKHILNIKKSCNLVDNPCSRSLFSQTKKGRSFLIWCLSKKNPNSVSKTNNFVPIIFVNMDSNAAYTDWRIIHELNHLVESKIIYIDDNVTEIDSGWTGYYTDNKTDKSKFPVNCGKKPFNEIINDLLAEQITRQYHAKGKSIITNPTEEKYNGGYKRDLEFIVRPFFDYYHDIIIKSRLDSITDITDVVGEENFDELGDLVQEHDKKIKVIRSNIFISDKREIIKDSIKKACDETKEERDKIYKKIGIPLKKRKSYSQKN